MPEYRVRFGAIGCPATMHEPDPSPELPPPDFEEEPSLALLRLEVSGADGAASGARWIGMSRATLQVSQFALSLITARLLLPEDFGVAALAMAVLNLATVFTELGIAAALIHTKYLSSRLVNSAFWMSIATGLATAGLLAALAWPISQIYGEPQLLTLLLVVAVSFAFSRSTVQIALLERTFQYRRLAIVETSAGTIGLITTPTLAALGVGPLSLVIGPAVSIFLRDVGLWFATPWRPTRMARREDIRYLWAYSRGLVGFNLLAYWSQNLDTLLLGRRVSTDDLGQYNRAYNLMMVPIQQSTWVLGRVLFPALARFGESRRRVALAWVRGTSAAAMLSVPLAVTMAATAPAAVVVLYGENWREMAAELTWLSLAAIPLLLAGSTEAVYRAIGRTDQLLALGLRSAAVTTVAIVTGLQWGTEGVAAALLVSGWVVLAVQAWPLFRDLDLSLRDLTPFLPVAAATATMATAQLTAGFAVPSGAGPFLTLCAQLVAGAAAYLFALWRLDHPGWHLLVRPMTRRKDR